MISIYDRILIHVVKYIRVCTSNHVWLQLVKSAHNTTYCLYLRTISVIPIILSQQLFKCHSLNHNQNKCSIIIYSA